MRNQLTKNDLALMQKELDDRRIRLRPQLIDEVKTARAFGDLSENFEYKAAKQEKNENERRIRYLENMIKTARVVETGHRGDGADFYDKITVLAEDTGEEESYRVVTAVRQDVLHGLISNESPVGHALLGCREGDTVRVPVGQNGTLTLKILKIEKGTDDGSVPLASF